MIIVESRRRFKGFRVGSESAAFLKRRIIMKRTITACLCVGLLLFISPQFSTSQETDVIKLPAPQTEGGMPLMQALKERKSTRGNFGPEEKLSMQTLSNLLWAADGVNRPGGHRTAPSAADWQNIQIYVATADGLFVYDAPQNALKVISKQDVRAISGLEGQASGPMKQDFAKTAPVSLVYVADMSKTKGMKWNGEDAGTTWSYANVGAIAQNVYLFCASEGLACIVRAMIDAAKVSEVFKLGPTQKPLLTSTIAQFKK
jgi:SagB-type dehydrogenase family enzyme